MYYATAQEMERLDALAVAHGLEIRQMMELAGWHMVSLFSRRGTPRRSKVTIVVGKGNKGGDGLSAARHLANNGWTISVIMVASAIIDEAKHHLTLVRKMGLPITFFSKNAAAARRAIETSDVLIDALIGYHLNGAPRGLFREVIEFMNTAKGNTIAYDIPSGVQATSGQCLSPCIRAQATLTLALPKRAFLKKAARNLCGDIFVADIGIPHYLYDTISPGSRPRFERMKDGFVGIS